jgi:hypothetical protein
MNSNFVLERVQVVEGSMLDYEILARYHYQPILTFPPTKVFKVVGSSLYYSQFPDPLSVIIFSQPFPNIVSRNKATAHFFQQTANTSANLKLVNEYILYLSRLITDTRYVRRGLATYLLRETLSLLQIPIIETLTPIDFTNSMYVKSGFEIYYQPASLKFTRLINAFKEIGIILIEGTSPDFIDFVLSRLSAAKLEFIEQEISVFLSGFRNADRLKPGRERTNFILSKVPPPQAYLIWFNPRSELASKVLQHRQNSPLKSL